MLDYIFLFQHLHPRVQQRALRLSLRKTLDRRSSRKEFMRVLGNVEQLIQRLVVLNARKLQGAQKVTGNRLHGVKTVRVTVIVTEHHILLSIQIVVATILCIEQSIQEQIVDFALRVAEERAAHSRDSLFLNFANCRKQLLPNFPQHCFLVDLETSKTLAQFHGFAQKRLARTVIGLELGTTSLQSLGELG